MKKEFSKSLFNFSDSSSFSCSNFFSSSSLIRFSKSRCLGDLLPCSPKSVGTSPDSFSSVTVRFSSTEFSNPFFFLRLLLLSNDTVSGLQQLNMFFVVVVVVLNIKFVSDPKKMSFQRNREN